MGSLGDFIRTRREEAGLKQYELAEKMGIDRSNLSQWETGAKNPGYDNRRKLAAALGIPFTEFEDGWRRWQIRLTKGEPGKIPVINRAPAGIAMDYEEYSVDSGQGHDYIDALGISDPNAFAVEVVGDSMKPNLLEGDLIILSPLSERGPSQGSIEGRVVFVRFSEDCTDKKLTGKCTLARVFRTKDGRIELRKDNPKYKPVIVPPDDITRMSVVLQRRQAGETV